MSADGSPGCGLCGAGAACPGAAVVETRAVRLSPTTDGECRVEVAPIKGGLSAVYVRRAYRPTPTSSEQPLLQPWKYDPDCPF
ncbi:MAG: hypothetical protein JWM64_2073 [Frankiales bacterium]|nr:hypothetical protein [Frankiales bacterium]